MERLNICIFEAYPFASRKKMQANELALNHEQYITVLSSFERDIRCDVLFVADGDAALPHGVSLEQYDGIIWTGSDLTIFKELPSVHEQISLAQTIYEMGIPSYGSCWGLQMACVAAGGKVHQNPKGREWGIGHAITQTEQASLHPLLEGKPDCFAGFVMHSDEVLIMPECGHILAGNEHCKVQAAAFKHKAGEFWATQYHPEYTLGNMAKLIGLRTDSLIMEGFFNAASEVEKYVHTWLGIEAASDFFERAKEHAIPDSITNRYIRNLEIQNWIDKLVIPLKGEHRGLG